MSKLPKLEGRMDFDELMSGITKGDARVAAILAGAWLDELLCHAIKFNMIKLNAKEQDDLFEASGLLATFSSRIKTAYALGLISKKLRIDLDAIRSIRNDYAHELRKVGLDYQVFKSRIVNLYSLCELPNKTEMTFGELLAQAVHIIGIFLIARTAPSHFSFDPDFMALLSCLDYSNFEEVRRRDNLC